MRVLIGCEESGTVRRAFEARGHVAYSNDLIPARDGGRHLQMDVLKALRLMPWDLVILHPECTKMTVSSNGTYAFGKPRHQERLDAVRWTLGLWELAVSVCPRVCLENPTGVLWPAMPIKPQYIHPWQHGHKETKKTGLGLHRLPNLIPTHDVYAEMMAAPAKERERIWRMAPGPNRKRDRSETYQGIADAMARQWG